LPPLHPTIKAHSQLDQQLTRHRSLSKSQTAWSSCLNLIYPVYFFRSSTLAAGHSTPSKWHGIETSSSPCSILGIVLVYHEAGSMLAFFAPSDPDFNSRKSLSCTLYQKNKYRYRVDSHWRYSYINIRLPNGEYIRI